MNATRPLTLTAPFDREDCGHGVWRLSERGPRAATVYLRGFMPPAGFDSCTSLSIDWLDSGGAVVAVLLPRGTVTVPVASALVHEPRPGLYRTLPLAHYDAGQARFWQRIFRLVRVPGGRLLLSWLAARSRHRS